MAPRKTNGTGSGRSGTEKPSGQRAGTKKTGGSKPAGSGKKTKAAAPGRPPKMKPLVYQPNMTARGIGAAVCIFLAVLIGLGMFGTQALVVDFLCNGIKGLVGYGFWIVAPLLIVAAVLLLIQRERPVRLRLWALGFLPVFLGAFLHLFLSPYQYEKGFKIVGKLWQDGIHLFSGGLAGGGLSISFAALFSKAGAGILFVLAFLALVAIAFRLTPARMLAMARRSKERRAQRDPYGDYADYDDYDDEYDDYDVPQAEPEPPRKEPVRGKEKAPEKPIKKDKPGLKGLFARKEKKQETRPAPEEADSLDDTMPFFPFEPDDVPLTVESDPVPSAESGHPTESRPLTRAAKAPAAPTEADEPTKPIWTPPAQPTRKEQKEEIQRESHQVARDVQASLDQEHREYIYPPLDVLTPPSTAGAQAAHEELQDTLDRLASVLASFGVDGHVAGAVQGPSVTRYEVGLEKGVRLNRLTNLADDVALALGVSSVRIAPVPGKISVVGIEVPNRVVTPVNIREVLDSDNFQKHKSSVAFSVGKDIGGNYIVGDCSKLPHMLIAGTTGSGKSVCINSLIVSMLYKSTPEEVRLIMVDPKMVELGGYNSIPHLLIPVVTDPKKAAGALQWAVTEMMKRYRLFAEAGVRELSSYNQWAKAQENVSTMPKVVIVIDELADLMLVAAKEVEESICRVAQMGRAAGMHLVIATQRPSADVITGLMKANIPSRIAFAVASSLESRIILDNTGAEKLVGKGDMLWFPLGSGKPLRVQGCFISDEEVAAVVDCVKQNSTAEYDNEVMAQIEQHAAESEKKGAKGGAFPAGDEGEEQDDRFQEAVDVTLELGQASASMLQRRMKLGYARAARLIDQMEERGIVGPFEGSKPRQLLITKEQWEQMKNGGGPAAEDPPEETPPPVEEEILTFEADPQPFDHP